MITGSLLAIGGGGYFIYKASKPPKRPLPAVYDDYFSHAEKMLKRGNRANNEILLTIDDGPHPESLKIILATLKKYKVPATFFVVGIRVKEHPDLVRQIMNDGHEVGNHTQDHLRLDTLSEQAVRNQIDFCDQNIFKATGRHASFIRPPGFRTNAKVGDILESHGLTTIGWNVGAKDFIVFRNREATAEDRARIGVEPDQIAERVLKQLKPGSIIVLHDIKVSALALPKIIEGAQKKGFKFITTAQMLARLPEPIMVKANPSAPLITASR
ncbi:MAG: polysaccharide deacetylase family protein [Armatimonadetes bacterium]|nr:polysaccharide deacetylase family protein [Armatimonadota bacterium]